MNQSHLRVAFLILYKFMIKNKISYKLIKNILHFINLYNLFIFNNIAYFHRFIFYLFNNFKLRFSLF